MAWQAFQNLLQNKRNTDVPQDMSSGEENCTIGFIVEFIATAIWFPSLYISETHSLMMVVSYNQNV